MAQKESVHAAQISAEAKKCRRLTDLISSTSTSNMQKTTSGSDISASSNTTDGRLEESTSDRMYEVSIQTELPLKYSTQNKNEDAR